MLGISFEITQESGCGSLIFTDSTGVYDPVLNPYGYGGPNPNYNQITGTQIVFTLSDGQIIPFTNFIPTQTADSIQYFAGDLGYGDIIPDQIAGISYTVYGSSGMTLGQSNSNVLFACNFISCFNGQVQRVIGPQSCTDKELDRLTKMWIRFIGIQAAVQCNSCCATGDIEELNRECSKFCIECQCR